MLGQQEIYSCFAAVTLRVWKAVKTGFVMKYLKYSRRISGKTTKLNVYIKLVASM